MEKMRPKKDVKNNEVTDPKLLCNHTIGGVSVMNTFKDGRKVCGLCGYTVMPYILDEVKAFIDGSMEAYASTEVAKLLNKIGYIDFRNWLYEHATASVHVHIVRDKYEIDNDEDPYRYRNQILVDWLNCAQDIQNVIKDDLITEEIHDYYSDTDIDNLIRLIVEKVSKAEDIISDSILDANPWIVQIISVYKYANIPDEYSTLIKERTLEVIFRSVICGDGVPDGNIRSCIATYIADTVFGPFANIYRSI